MRKQQLWTGIGASVGILILILDGRTALEGAQAGIDLCLRTVIPSLFPFFLLSILLTSSFMGMTLSVLRPVAKLFSIPEGAESLLVCAFLGGYPVGAQSISDGYHAGQLKKEDAQRMLAYCNNAGPAFLFGMVGAQFAEKWMAWALWGIHILSALLVSMVFSGNPGRVKMGERKPVSLSGAMVSALRIMAQVCGWVILFRVIMAFLNRWVLWILPVEVQVTLTGLLELSNGCCVLASIEDTSLRFLICSGILAFGGLCVTMQTVSVTKGLRLKYYLLGKGLQTLLSLLLSAALLWPVWILPAALTIFFLLILQKMRKNSSNPLYVGV